VDVPSRCDVPVLRPAPADATGPLQMASFPLVPFGNRIENGRFRWQGREVVLPPNHSGDAFPLHGYGGYAHWRVVAVEATAVELERETGAGDWPWPYATRQRSAIEGDACVVRLSVQNRGTTAMPSGRGHHPCFPRTEATRMRATLPVAWPPDARLVPTGALPNPRAVAPMIALAPRAWLHYELRLGATPLGWRGRARRTRRRSRRR
jgi:aldose 1-epimerase